MNGRASGPTADERLMQALEEVAEHLRGDTPLPAVIVSVEAVEGYQASSQGRRAANPYVPDSEAAKEWQQGFDLFRRIHGA